MALRAPYFFYRREGDDRRIGRTAFYYHFLAVEGLLSAM
jgi:hypothetical protein